MNGCSSTYQGHQVKSNKDDTRTTSVCAYTTTIDNINLNRSTTTYIHPYTFYMNKRLNVYFSTFFSWAWIYLI